MDRDVTIINPLEHPGWDDLVLNSPPCGFFHTSVWARVISEAYGYQPRYFTLLGEGRLRGLVPVMQINSVLTGCRGVSLPFSDYCEPAFEDVHLRRQLLAAVLEQGKEKGWRTFELRGGDKEWGGQPCSRYFHHTLALSGDEAEILAGFRGSTRRNIKKASKSGVEITRSTSLAAVRSFHRLNALTRRDHGLPGQPLRFFRKLHEYVIAPGHGFVMLASHRGKTIAGAVFLHFGRGAEYKYGASDRQYQSLRANNLIMWEAIRWYSRRGCHTFSFGRTHPDNQGLLQFKRGWHPQEHTVHYYRWALRNGHPSHDPQTLTAIQPFIKRAPIPLLNMVGSLLYRHMG